MSIAIGPLYVGWRGGFLASFLTNTCVQSVKSLWTNVGLLDGERGCWHCSWFMSSFNVSTYESGSLGMSEGVEMNNSPGSLREVPTISAVEHLRSSLTAVLIPRSTSGRDSVQRWGLLEHLRAVLSWQWNRSTIPFAVCCSALSMNSQELSQEWP